MFVLVLAILSVGFPTQRESTELDKRSIKARLETSASSFAEASELYQLVDRMAKQVSAADRAEFELFRLRALRRSLSTIDRFEPTDPAQRAWLKKYEDEAVFSEPAGEWLVKADLYWSLEARYRGNAIAEEIAWEGANAGLPGECEGYLPCHFVAVLLTDGRYLQLYPAGAHSPEAIERIGELLADAIKPNSPYTSDSRDAAELRESIGKIRMILEGTSNSRKTELIVQLMRIQEMYR